MAHIKKHYDEAGGEPFWMRADHKHATFLDGETFRDFGKKLLDIELRLDE